ncbi:hypothetical protein PHYSODRAFT_337699 [Phytophthora sojae]|uniref:Uncharacterized protein n=1 Tax=Phytophthora sojae (strain P6497) TaxID=1094619 RepID=G5A1Y6_PHYSP|nr:hypothetical protein PHYSODRAFT_337699 [Phytophthora sojae]EGZ10934.1 hypothetical protein PHYSODRAFT_337699 [Phytophthora sojae]|eukprot:XP_009533679.1 hypothetical protein PHYSODRAFT_337699 [Phytophthora sojae]
MSKATAVAGIGVRKHTANAREKEQNKTIDRLLQEKHKLAQQLAEVKHKLHHQHAEERYRLLKQHAFEKRGLVDQLIQQHAKNLKLDKELRQAKLAMVFSEDSA